MKLHYFNQTSADADDVTLSLMKEVGTVPQGCLIGGMVARAMTLNGKSPCDSCNGPRERCGGTPRLTEEEEDRAQQEQHYRDLFLGQPESVLERILKGKS